jgi:versiconal hemiacetal acetate esterase
MPPTYLAVCGKDPLRDDGLVFAKQLKKVGVKTKINLYDGYPHVFWATPTPPAQVALKDIIEGMNWVIENIEA